MSQDNTTSRLCNLEELINANNGKMVDIIIPKIQRAYAQGRKREANIRKPFITRILEAISKGESMELNFVYGSKTETENGYSFELLDGQQRVTTLFLLYWYFSMAEGVELPEALKHITYETRTTSTDFIKKLVDSKIDVTSQKPSKSICSRQWYTLAYDKDSTVLGMLTMLDTIHDIYNIMERPTGMHAGLAKIRFYELDLRDFGLTEEIYIKMNARGLQLTPFENFKADIVKYMKDDQNPNYKNLVKMDIVGHPDVQYYLSFSQKLDSKWLNLFWNKTDEDNNTYCDKFFRFFYRYFANKYFLEVQGDLAAQEFRPKRDEGWDFLWTTSPRQSSAIDNTYFGFAVYKRILDKYPEYINKIEKVLDALCSDAVSSLLKDRLIAPWSDKEKMSFFDEDYRLQDAVMFGAITEYLEVSDSNVDTENLRKWIRIVWNVIENQLFQNVNELVSTLRYLSEIIRTKGATEDIYDAIAKQKDKNYTRAIREEIRKAEIITNNPEEDWESAFIDAEKHDFFRGSISYFLFDPIPASSDLFRHRTEIISQMFDKDGIVEVFRLEHILIMSMMRQLNSRKKMGVNAKGQVSISITEKNDTLHHLKSLLQEKTAIREFLCKLGDMPSVNDVVAYLKDQVNAPVEYECDGDDVRMNGKIMRAFKRLATDVRLYSYIADRQDSNHILEFTYLDYLHYTINKKRAWYSKFFIESERNIIIPRLVSEEGLEFQEQDEIKCFNTYGDYYGYDVDLRKTLANGQHISINFRRGTDVDFYLYKPSAETLVQFGMEMDSPKEWVIVAWQYYETMNDYDAIVQKLRDVEAKCMISPTA